MKKNYLLIKYEELLKNPSIEFMKISNYVEKNYKLSFEKNQVIKAIEKCNFEKLTNQEEREGFQEAADDKNGSKKKFFILDLKITGNHF